VNQRKDIDLRSFLDSAGVPWDVMVGRESWGTVVAIFVAREGKEPPRQALLETASADEGTRLLMSMEAEDLQVLLRNAVRKATD